MHKESKDESAYLEEAEKENPTADGIKDAVEGKTIKQRFNFMSALFGILFFLILLLVSELFNILTIISALGAYFYTAKHFNLAYIEFKDIVFTKFFFLTFFTTYFILSNVKKIFIKKEKTEEAKK